MKRAGMVAVLLALATWAWAEGDASGERPRMSVEEISSCMRRNLVDRGSLRDIQIEATDARGKTRQLKMRLFWKPTKTGLGRMNLRVLEPEDLKGATYLLVERDAGEEIHVFLPKLSKVRRLEAADRSQALWDTDFSYAEIRHVQGLLADGRTERKQDGKLGERAVYVLETETGGEGSGYEKVVSYVDQTSCVPLRTEFYGAGEKPRKVLEADVATLDSIDTYWYVLGFTMRDLEQRTTTTLKLSDLYLLERHGEELFDPLSLHKIAE
jgi:Outer membrane lipoprotein-sorting protein